MSNNSLSDVIRDIENLFSILNSHFFDGKLQHPIITVSPGAAKRTGWCTSWKAWTQSITETSQEKVASLNSDGYYEINICSEYIARPLEGIVAMLLHEMVHLLNLQQGVKDTSRYGSYHNEKFKEAAEQHGLVVKEKTKGYGYSETSLSDRAKTFVKGLKRHNFSLYRKIPDRSIKPKQNSRRYVCPGCRTIIRATKEVNVMCGDCGFAFIKT